VEEGFSELETKLLKRKSWNILAFSFAFLLIIYAFLLSIDLISESSNLLGKEVIRDIILATSNPFVGLFIGLLSTAIIQSSSTTTSIIVALVATGTLTIENAVPMVMGANIGTTITSTIVAMGFITNSKRFRKAIATGTIHGIFNIATTILLFPLEYYFKVLSKLSIYVTSIFSFPGAVSGKSFMLGEYTINPVTTFIIKLFQSNSLLIVTLAIVLLFISIKSFGLLLRNILTGDSQKKFQQVIFRNPIKSLLWGTGVTAMIHSSSLVTSLTVPLVANDKISLRTAFPFIIGANIGTTFTALTAAISQSNAAISIALTHVLFNVIGALIFFPIPAIRQMIVELARGMGKITMKYKVIGFLYILLVFFVIPFILIYTSK